jgi:hypothetical protein
MRDLYTRVALIKRKHLLFSESLRLTGHSEPTGLSLLGYPGLEDLDPVYCMPTEMIEHKGLRKGWLALPRREV